MKKREIGMLHVFSSVQVLAQYQASYGRQVFRPFLIAASPLSNLSRDTRWLEDR